MVYELHSFALEVMKAYLILDEELDTLNWRSSCFRDGGRNTTHCTKQSVTLNPSMQHQKRHFVD